MGLRSRRAFRSCGSARPAGCAASDLRLLPRFDALPARIAAARGVFSEAIKYYSGNSARAKHPVQSSHPVTKGEISTASKKLES